MTVRASAGRSCFDAHDGEPAKGCSVLRGVSTIRTGALNHHLQALPSPPSTPSLSRGSDVMIRATKIRADGHLSLKKSQTLPTCLNYFGETPREASSTHSVPEFKEWGHFAVDYAEGGAHPPIL